MVSPVRSVDPRRSHHQQHHRSPGGALGVPCVVILDNGSITNWPDEGDRIPLYPMTRLIRRKEDDWSTTLRRGWRCLRSMLQEP